MKDIFRKYPSTYEGVIPTLCANLEELDEPEAKASLIWIIGEYAMKIDNADDLLGSFVDSFTDESYAVQLQTLTAVVKLFLQKPDGSQGLVQRVLSTATKDCDSPDVRDRAYIYWRLLSTDPGAAKSVVLANRPPISLPQLSVPPAVLEELMQEFSTLASVYHKPSKTFIGSGRLGAAELGEGDLSARKALQHIAAGQQAENLLDFEDSDSTSLNSSNAPVGLAATADLAHTAAAASLISGTSTNPLDDLVSIFGNAGFSGPGPTSNLGSGMTSPVTGLGGMNGLGGLSFASPTPSNQMQSPSVFGMTSPTSVNGGTPTLSALAKQSQQPQEDLLGLF